MCKSGVYQITLKTDGRSYIGSAVNIEARWRQHRDKSRSLKNIQVISRAISKHGIDAFNWQILEECSVEKLIEREQHWLDLIRPFADEDNGFNIRKVADSNIGIRRTDESKKKQSDTMSGILKTAEHRANMSKSWHNNRSNEYYKLLSDRVKGDKNPAKRKDVREKISKSMLGKTWKNDIDRLTKHKAQRTGKKYSEQAKENMRAAQQKNKTRSPEAKEKFYLAQRRLYEITQPTGESFQIYSRELKSFCIEQQLSYANLVGTAKTNKVYKGGWKARLV